MKKIEIEGGREGEREGVRGRERGREKERERPQKQTTNDPTICKCYFDLVSSIEAFSKKIFN